MGVLDLFDNFFPKGKKENKDVLCRVWIGLQELQKFDNMSFKMARQKLIGKFDDLDYAKEKYEEFHRFLDNKMLTERQEKQCQNMIDRIEKDFQYVFGNKDSQSKRMSYEIQNFISDEDYKNDNWNNCFGMTKIKEFVKTELGLETDEEFLKSVKKEEDVQGWYFQTDNNPKKIFAIKNRGSVFSIDEETTSEELKSSFKNGARGQLKHQDSDKYSRSIYNLDDLNPKKKKFYGKKKYK